MSDASAGPEAIGSPHRDAKRARAAQASLSKIGLATLLGLPGALVVYFSFNSGGIFELTTAFGTLVVLVAILIGLALARRPCAGFGARGLLACGLLALFALWTWLSADWSHATGRALVSLDRVLLYLAILTLFASIPASTERFRWVIRGLLMSSAAVSIIGMTSRLLPALWQTTPGLVSERLSYPITYWNTFAFLVGLSCILAVHHASDERELPAMRILGAALLPLLGATLLLTFSRGALGVTVLAIVAYVVIARPSGLLGGALAVLPTAAVAIYETYTAKMVQEGVPLTPMAIAEGHHLAWTIGACAVGAGLLRALTLPLDARISRISISRRSRRVGLIGWVGVTVIVLIAFVAARGPSLVHHQYENFVRGTQVTSVDGSDQADRLLSIGNDGRLTLWKGAFDAYRQDPLRGTGAGTYRLQAEQNQRTIYDRVFGYSLYFETLGELGIVGIVLLGGALLTILIAIALRLGDSGRPTYTAGFVLVLAWIVHTGIDIDWQTPAICVPVFALGGLSLARPRKQALASWVGTSGTGRPPERAWATSPWVRPALALVCLAIATFPARMALAQADLAKSIDALKANACDRAQADARDVISMLDIGARPYEVLAMCAARQRNLHGAVRWARAGVTHDPENWEPHYALALAQGTAGIDPRRQAKIAHEMNPLGQLTGRRALGFRGSRSRSWIAVALHLPFWFD